MITLTVGLVNPFLRDPKFMFTWGDVDVALISLVVGASLESTRVVLKTGVFILEADWNHGAALGIVVSSLALLLFWFTRGSKKETAPFDQASCVIDAVNQAATMLGQAFVDRVALAEHIRSCASTQRLVTQLQPLLDEVCFPRSYWEVEMDLHRTGQAFPAVVAAHAMGVLWDVPVILCGEDDTDGNPGERLRVGSDKQTRADASIVTFHVSGPLAAGGMGHMRFDGTSGAARSARTQHQSPSADMTILGANALFACVSCGMNKAPSTVSSRLFVGGSGG